MIDEQIVLMVTKNRQLHLEAAGAFTCAQSNRSQITEECKRQKPTCSEQEKRTVPEAIPNEREKSACVLVQGVRCFMEHLNYSALFAFQHLPLCSL